MILGLRVWYCTVLLFDVCFLFPFFVTTSRNLLAGAEASGVSGVKFFRSGPRRKGRRGRYIRSAVGFGVELVLDVEIYSDTCVRDACGYLSASDEGLYSRRRDPHNILYWSVSSRSPCGYSQYSPRVRIPRARARCCWLVSVLV